MSVMRNFIRVILTQYVSILMEVTCVSVRRDMMVMDSLTVTVSNMMKIK